MLRRWRKRQPWASWIRTWIARWSSLRAWTSRRGARIRAPRREVHARKLLHRAIHVLIHDAQGCLFLQRRSMGKDTFPGCWDSSCSGHVDAGEDYFTAARRELVEEFL